MATLAYLAFRPSESKTTVDMNDIPKAPEFKFGLLDLGISGASLVGLAALAVLTHGLAIPIIIATIAISGLSLVPGGTMLNAVCSPYNHPSLVDEIINKRY